MLNTFVLTLKDGLEMVILAVFLFSFILKMKKRDLNKYVYWGLIIALPYSALLVYSLLNLKIEKGIESFMALIGLPIITVVIVWIWYQYFNFNKSKNRKSTSLFSKLTIFLTYLFLGINFETKLMLFPSKIVVDSTFATGLNTELLLKYSGGLLGIVFSIIFAVILLKAQKKISLKQCLSITTVIYFVNFLKYSILIVYALMIYDLIPVTTTFLSFFAPFYNNLKMILYIMFGITAVWIVFVNFKPLKLKKDASLNPAQLRKLKANIRSKQRWARSALIAVIIFTSVFTFNYVYAGQTITEKPAVPLQVNNDKFVIQKNELKDEKLHRYSFTTEDEFVIEFFLIEKAEGAYGVVYDACNVCGDSGYYQDKDKIICIRCDVIMNKLTLGFPGGCNPIPLNYSENEDSIVIQLDDLLAEKDVFVN
ncbi:putative membrane protein [Halanaerobium saccharolyticum]|uniref:Putative membrane protein n=1 Tax=Halanaerobium saccharolyticum TaxID=43595 RepID=A0A4R7YTW5_9FIRM|nr:Fe-S-containing protein [Halanaerobium saccharolyticum]RAK10274.1 putative membrane protein [Halanaerobium saccharolyticum]TDW00486.1 putative membrane protein [Halanaerobium saccharolyticum]TDX52071.1 putative membrane protein [Halanaerobium saccharolyticum]